MSIWFCVRVDSKINLTREGSENHNQNLTFLRRKSNFPQTLMFIYPSSTDRVACLYCILQQVDMTRYAQSSVFLRFYASFPHR